MVAAAREQLPSAQGLKEFKAALTVLLPALHGLSQRETADLLQLSVSRVGSLQAEARHPSLPPKGPHGGRPGSS